MKHTNKQTTKRKKKKNNGNNIIIARQNACIAMHRMIIFLPTCDWRSKCSCSTEVCDNDRFVQFLMYIHISNEWWGNLFDVRSDWSQRSRLTWNGWCFIVYMPLCCLMLLHVVRLLWTLMWTQYEEQTNKTKKPTRAHNEEERRWWCQWFGDGAFRPGYKLGAQNVLPTSQHQFVRLSCCFPS